MRRGHVLLAAGLTATGLILQGCAAKPVVYGPIGPEAPHGYRDRQNADGGFTVLVAMPGQTRPAELRAFFDRRAGKLCPSGVERANVFKMQRSDYTNMYYRAQTVMVSSRVWTGAEVEGYVYCKPGPDAPKAEAIPAP